MSDNPVFLFVGDYESADLQKLEQLHHKGTPALVALSSYGSTVLGANYLRKTNAFDTPLTKPPRAEYS